MNVILGIILLCFAEQLFWIKQINFITPFLPSTPDTDRSVVTMYWDFHLFLSFPLISLYLL